MNDNIAANGHDHDVACTDTRIQKFEIDQDIENAESKILSGKFLEMHEILYYIAKQMKPKNYLEIGVFMGRSLAIVLKASSQTKGYAIDTWESHAGVPNTTPEALTERFKDLGIANLPTFLSGHSYDALPEYQAQGVIPKSFQLILIDGNHGYESGKKDMEFCFPRLDISGVLILHDTMHFPHLAELFYTFKKRYRDDFIFMESCLGLGTCMAFRLPLSGKIFCR